MPHYAATILQNCKKKSREIAECAKTRRFYRRLLRTSDWRVDGETSLSLSSVIFRNRRAKTCLSVVSPGLGQSVKSEASECAGRVNQCGGRSPIWENRMIDRIVSPRPLAVDLKGHEYSTGTHGVFHSAAPRKSPNNETRQLEMVRRIIIMAACESRISKCLPRRNVISDYLILGIDNGLATTRSAKNIYYEYFDQWEISEFLQSYNYIITLRIRIYLIHYNYDIIQLHIHNTIFMIL